MRRALAPFLALADEAPGAAARVTGAFAPGVLAFTPDGAAGIVTAPGRFRILLDR